MVFRICIYRCIACRYYTKFGIIVASNARVATNLVATKVASNAYGAPYAKTRNSICMFSSLLGNLPSPLNHKFLVSCTPDGALFLIENIWCVIAGYRSLSYVR